MKSLTGASEIIHWLHGNNMLAPPGEPSGVATRSCTNV
jgi:hypothetical protein